MSAIVNNIKPLFRILAEKQPLGRKANKIVIGLQKKFLKNSKVLGYPHTVSIDPCSLCNLSCALCPAGEGKKGKKLGMMSFVDYRKIVDELAPYVCAIHLYNWGEPFLNKDIFKMIKYTRRKGIEVHISSNLNHFNKDMASELVEADLNELVISLDGASQETYEQYRKGGNFRRVIGNIKAIVAEKKRQKSEKPRICWKFLVMEQNEHEIEKARKMARELGIEFAIGELHPQMDKEVFENIETQIKETKKWLPSNESYSRYDYEKKKVKNELKNSCNWLWSQAVIESDGSVSPCCRIYEEKYCFGNAIKEDFGSIWNNEKYSAARDVVARDRKGKVSTVCHICKKNNAMI